MAGGMPFRTGMRRGNEETNELLSSMVQVVYGSRTISGGWDVRCWDGLYPAGGLRTGT